MANQIGSNSSEWTVSRTQRSQVILSVIIPTMNSGKFLGNCLASLFDQICASDLEGSVEVIIVDDSSDDDTLNIARKYPTRIIKGGGCLGKSRNIGLEKARGKYVAYTDADCILPRGWVAKIIKTLSKGNVSAVGGPDITPSNRSIRERGMGLIEDARLFARTPSKDIEVSYRLRGCNMAFRRNDLIEAGSFNDELKAMDEKDAIYKLHKSSKKIVFDENLKVYHERRKTFKSYFWQNFWWGVYEVKFWKLHNFIYWADIVPPAAILANLMILFISMYVPWILIPTVFFDLTVIATNTALIGKKSGKRFELLIVPFATAVKVFGLGLGFLYGLCNVRSIN